MNNRTSERELGGIEGIKGSEYKDLSEVLPDNVRADTLPEGVRAYIKERGLVIPGAQLTVSIYRLLDGGTKGRRSWVGNYEGGDRLPEPLNVCQVAGAGDFFWMAKWDGPQGKENGLVSDVIRIEDTAANRAIHDAYQAKLAAKSAPAGLPVAAAPAPASGMGIGVEGILAIIAAAEEKSLKTFERIMALAKPAEQPMDILKGTYKASMDMMKEASDMTVNAYRSVTSKAKAEMNKEPADEGDGEAAPESFGDVIKTFIPEIKLYLDKLIGGGPVGHAVKTLVLGSDEWKEIFQDKEKMGIAIAAMEQEFGSEKTEKAMQILLNKREDKAAAKKGKRA